MDINTVMYSPVTNRDEVFKIPFDFDPTEHKTAKAAAAISTLHDSVIKKL